MADSTILVKGEGWKFKAVLGLGGLTTLIILAFLYRLEVGIITLAIGLACAGRLTVTAIHRHKLAGYEQRRIEAETAKLESEAVRARAQSYFVETNSGVFQLAGIEVERFYPAVSASKLLADIPALLPAPELPLKRLLDIDWRHLLILGPTGSGKTTVANHLIDNAEHNAIIYALDPHATQNARKGLPWSPRAQVVGDGRDWAAIDAMLTRLLGEMNDRFSPAATIAQPVYVANDEWLAVLKNCPHAREFFETIGSEAAKVNMHLIIATQAATVDDLGCSAAVRDNLVELRLDHALKAQNRGELRWGKRRDSVETVELPGRYLRSGPPQWNNTQPPELPRVEEDSDEWPTRISQLLSDLDAGPVPPAPTRDELRICELWDEGTRSLRAIHAGISDTKFGGRQAEEIKQVLRRFGRVE